MDASKFYTTNAEEWYPNMLECGDCDTETEAGTLADMLQWAMDHSKVCDTKLYYREFFSDGVWLRSGRSPMKSSEMLSDKEFHERHPSGYEERWVPVED